MSHAENQPLSPPSLCHPTPPQRLTQTPPIHTTTMTPTHNVLKEKHWYGGISSPAQRAQQGLDWNTIMPPFGTGGTETVSPSHELDHVWWRTDSSTFRKVKIRIFPTSEKTRQNNSYLGDMLTQASWLGTVYQQGTEKAMVPYERKGMTKRGEVTGNRVSVSSYFPIRLCIVCVQFCNICTWYIIYHQSSLFPCIGNTFFI